MKEQYPFFVPCLEPPRLYLAITCKWSFSPFLNQDLTKVKISSPLSSPGEHVPSIHTCRISTCDAQTWGFFHPYPRCCGSSNIPFLAQHRKISRYLSAESGPTPAFPFPVAYPIQGLSFWVTSTLILAVCTSVISYLNLTTNLSTQLITLLAIHQ